MKLVTNRTLVNTVGASNTDNTPRVATVVVAGLAGGALGAYFPGAVMGCALVGACAHSLTESWSNPEQTDKPVS